MKKLETLIFACTYLILSTTVTTTLAKTGFGLLAIVFFIFYIIYDKNNE